MLMNNIYAKVADEAGADEPQGTAVILSYAKQSASARLAADLETIAHSKAVGHISIKALDEALGGIVPGRLTIIAGEPGSGKTSLLNQIKDEAATQGAIVVYVTNEPTSAQLTQKSIAGLSKGTLNSGEIGAILNDPVANPDKTAALEETCKRYEHIAHNIIIIDDDTINIVDLAGIMSEIKHEANGAPVVMFVDYLQLIPPVDRNTTIEERLLLGEIVSGLRRITNSLGIATFAISSTTRNSYNQKNLSLGIFSGCQRIEYSADAAMFLTVDCAKETRDKCMATTVRPVAIRILKNRFGRVGTVNLNFDTAHSSFTERS